jgi:cell division protein FtsL
VTRFEKALLLTAFVVVAWIAVGCVGVFAYIFVQNQLHPGMVIEGCPVRKS